MAGILEPPVNLHALITDPREVRITAKHLGGECDGLLRWRESKQRFFLYYDDESERARSNLAHELAHLFIPEHAHAIRTGLGEHFSRSGTFPTDGVIEWEADTFGFELLIPTPFYRQAAAEPTIAGIRATCDRFDSSYACAARAVAMHADDPVAILTARDGQVVAGYVNEAMRDAGAPWSLLNTRVPRDTPTARAERAGGEHRAAVDASRWFTGYRGDPDLYEEAFATKYGVYTVLSGHACEIEDETSEDDDA